MTPSRLPLFAILLALSLQTQAAAPNPWVTFDPKPNLPGAGKHVVFVTGDDEYKSEEGMPVLAKILADRHGFKCTVLFAINRQTGVIDTNQKDNIPGLEALDSADLLVIFTRFRTLPDDQMAHIVNYVEHGKPVIGLRTATHAFNYPAPKAGEKPSASAYTRYGWTSREKNYEGGFGRQVLGETWVNHWGAHGRQSTRGILAPGAANHPILRGIKDDEIWGVCDVYEVKLPMQPGITPLVMGQVVAGMNPTDPPAGPEENPRTKQAVNKNDPMMPVAWVKQYTGATGKSARVFTTTMGGAMSGKRDWDNEGFRRLFVNAAYWCTGLESRIDPKSDVSFSGGEGFKRGIKPSDVK